jgi:Phage late-transcription coactivator
MPTKNEISEFSELINSIAAEHNITRMDAIIHHCEQSGMEVDIASTLIASALKSKIREEAQELNLLKKTSKLPL